MEMHFRSGPGCPQVESIFVATSFLTFVFDLGLILFFFFFFFWVLEVKVRDIIGIKVYLLIEGLRPQL